MVDVVKDRVLEFFRLTSEYKTAKINHFNITTQFANSNHISEELYHKHNLFMDELNQAISKLENFLKQGGEEKDVKKYLEKFNQSIENELNLNLEKKHDLID